ncbi:cytochrome c oxidase subunit II [Sphingobium sp. RSMS]|uniref:cytochrome c oxidase subunit II n=1 Tax=Sphingobium sp. RSMS TaxID=520734 RepID=UPI0020A2D1D7|nr:cytochrome c oxidase subunit II [Sphingobium sp. RSMS]UXC91480.1 cytochrome c oxidase subunit II [Sphingobium sp. RSMS]
MTRLPIFSQSTKQALAGWPPPVLDPAGPFASSVTALSWILFAIGAAILALVLVGLWVALVGPNRLRSRLGGTRVIWLAGIALPVVVLTALLIYGLTLTRGLRAPTQPSDIKVRVTGEMWWWRVAYLDGEGRVAATDANEIHIPVGKTVTVELESSDVIHSFWVPRLSGKIDMVPGRRNVLRMQADAPGVYAGQCAEYCGGAHALMGFMVVAHDPGDYAQFMAARSNPAPSPKGEATRGAQLFRNSGCGACHRIAGTAANGLAGPDLSHVGSRRTLGAGILPNNRGTMIGWIGDPQSLKPGNRMPAYSMLPGRDLTAIAAYLETLR